MAAIKVIIGKSGEVSTEVMGVKGQGCSALSQALADALGITVEDREMAEFYEEDEATVTAGV